MSLYSKNYREVQHYSCNDPKSYTYVEGYGFAPPPPLVTERRMLQWYANGIGFSVLFYFLLVNILPFLLFGVFSIFRPTIRMYGNQIVASPVVYTMVSILSGTLSKILPFLFFLLLCRIPMKVAFPLRKFSTSFCISGVSVALGASVIGLFSSNFIAFLLSMAGLAPRISGLDLPQELAPAILFGINVALLQPVIEELVFRGIIFSSLRRFGDSFALLISAILFSLFHGNFAQGPNAFVVGLVIGYFVLCTGSLWVGIIIHVVNNSMVLLLNFASQGLSPVFQELLSLAVFTVYLVLGLVALLVLVKQHPKMFMFIRSTTYATERNKYRVFFTSMTMMVALSLLVISMLQNLTAV